MPSTGTEAILINPDPCAYLPHRPPFLFVDWVLSRQAGVHATASFAVPAGWGYFPPLLLVECMAQLGGIAAGQLQGEGGVLAALNEVRLPAEVRAGTRFAIFSRVLRSFGNLAQIAGEVREEGTGALVASAVLTLALAGSSGGTTC